MPDLITTRLAEVTDLCREFGIERLALFGSFARNEQRRGLSDVDFLVTYPDDFDYGPWMSNHIEFRQRLVDLFRRPVDLVIDTSFQDPLFADSVAKTRKTVYERENARVAR